MLIEKISRKTKVQICNHITYANNITLSITASTIQYCIIQWATLSIRRFKKITKEMPVNNIHDLLSEALLRHTGKGILKLGMYTLLS